MFKQESKSETKTAVSEDCRRPTRAANYLALFTSIKTQLS